MMGIWITSAWRYGPSRDLLMRGRFWFNVQRHRFGRHRQYHLQIAGIAFIFYTSY